MDILCEGSADSGVQPIFPQEEAIGLPGPQPVWPHLPLASNALRQELDASCSRTGPEHGLRYLNWEWWQAVPSFRKSELPFVLWLLGGYLFPPRPPHILGLSGYCCHSCYSSRVVTLHISEGLKRHAWLTFGYPAPHSASGSGGLDFLETRTSLSSLVSFLMCCRCMCATSASPTDLRSHCHHSCRALSLREVPSSRGVYSSTAPLPSGVWSLCMLNPTILDSRQMQASFESGAHG